MKNLPINTFNGVINNQSVQLINARDLYDMLQVKSHFKDWIRRRLSDSPFKKDLDFIERSILSDRGFFKAEAKEYHLTVEMAKLLCLMENNEIGYQIRQRFIAIEQSAVQLAEQLQQQLLAIPAYLRNNPQQVQSLIEQAQAAYLTANP